MKRNKQGASMVIVLCFVVLFMGLGGAAMTASASALQTAGRRSARQIHDYTTDSVLMVLKEAVEQENSAMMQALERELFDLYTSADTVPKEITYRLRGLEGLLPNPDSDTAEVMIHLRSDRVQNVFEGAGLSQKSLTAQFTMDYRGTISGGEQVQAQLDCSYGDGVWEEGADGSFTQTKQGVFQVTEVRRGSGL